MATQLIQEFEARLETTLKNIENIDIKIGKHDGSSSEAVLLRQLRNAHSNLALALNCRIADEMKRTDCYVPFATLKMNLHEAEMEVLASANSLGAFEDGSMKQRWHRLKVAEEHWWNAIDACNKHLSTCPNCLANF